MIKHLFITLMLALPQFAKAQQESAQFSEYVSFHPFHFVNNGIRIDYDRRIGKNHWIQLGPQLYASERSGNTGAREFNELLGIGVSVFHRIYVGNLAPFSGTYFSYGFTYNNYKLKYTIDQRTENETQINKFGGDIIIGYQKILFDKMMVDVYAGLGGRYSDFSFKGTEHEKFDDFMYDYGFTGNVLIVGIRIGFGF